MRYFWVRIFLSMTALSTAAGAGTLCVVNHRIPQAIVCCLAFLAAVWIFVRTVRMLTGAVSEFASALEMDDTTFRMPEDRFDSDMRCLSESMNRIMRSHKEDRLALETRKLYYDRILSVMTHEMRNSISPVISLSDDMMHHPERYDAESRAEAVGVIYAQSEGIKRFLDSYHTLTHLPAPAIRPTDAQAFFNGIKTAFDSRCAHAGLPLRMISYTVPVGLSLEIDPDLMRQAVGNLLVNAIDAVSDSPRPEIKVVVSQTEGRPIISVEDNGRGISPAVMANLFQPFITDKPGGTGIGLCLSRQIVMLHGGELKAASTGAHGTVFAITLPGGAR